VYFFIPATKNNHLVGRKKLNYKTMTLYYDKNIIDSWLQNTKPW